MNSSEFDVADIWRRYWPYMVTTVCVFVAFLFFGLYLLHRQELADQRNELYRSAICAALRTPTPPGRKVPPSITDLRAKFARPGHPTDCEPPVEPRHSSTLAPTPEPVRTVYLKPTTAQASESPTPQHSNSPTPRPSPHPSPHPSPTPSPSPTCDLQHVLRCLGP